LLRISAKSPIAGNRVILKIPLKNNYGFWIDNNLVLDHFQKKFAAIEISRENFEEKWKLL